MKVTKEIERLEHSSVKLTVTVAKKDVAENYNETLGKYVKQVQIPGFRKGHVPASVLERKYGEQVKLESASDLIDKALNEIFSDEKEAANRPLPYAQPELKDMPAFDTSKDFTFSVTYDVFPSVKVENLDGISVKEPQVTVSDDDVSEELKAIQERNAVVIDKKDDEAVEKDNIVTINIVEKDAEGNEVASTKREGFTFTIGTEENVYKIDDEIIGMKKNETKEVSKEDKKYSVTVTQIKVRNLPALDDELAQDVNEKYKTLDDLKKDITLNLNTAKDKKVNDVKSNELLTKIVEKYPFEIPSSMLKAELDGRWQMMAQQFQTTPEELDKMITASGQKKEDILTQWTGDAEKMLKSRIVVDNLIRERNITVTPEEIEAEYKNIADGNGLTVEEVKKHYDNPRTKEYLIDDVKEQKLYKELFAQVKIEKGDKVSFKDLFNL